MRIPRASVFALVLPVVALAARASALTPPVGGAVPKPDALALSWPFTAGEAVTLLSGYSPSGGSSLHDGTERTNATNDYFALDLTLEDHPDHGRGQPVRAAADGVVVKAGWATQGWANYGQRVLVQHDIGDGHTYVTMYAHLERIDVAEGDVVARGAQIGTLGASCQGALTCGSFGTPHLHFALHRDSTIGGSGTGGSYGGVAVVPEIIDDAQDLARGGVHVSANHEGEPPPPPPPDPACVFHAGAPLFLEEDGPCARRLGPPEYFHAEDGHGGASLWTYAIEAASPDNRVHTLIHVEGPADLALSVVVPAYATSERARYIVATSDTALEVLVDQAAAAGTEAPLVTLTGVSGDVEVRLADNTGEAYTGEATAKKLAFDAIVVRAASDEPPPVDAGPDPFPDAGPMPDGGAGNDDDDDEDEDEGADDEDDDLIRSPRGGCSSSPVGLAGVWALLALSRARRRR